MIQRMPYVRRGLNSLYDVSENREIRFSEKCKNDTLKECERWEALSLCMKNCTGRFRMSMPIWKG